MNGRRSDVSGWRAGIPNINTLQIITASKRIILLISQVWKELTELNIEETQVPTPLPVFLPLRFLPISSSRLQFQRHLICSWQRKQVKRGEKSVFGLDFYVLFKRGEVDKASRKWNKSNLYSAIYLPTSPGQCKLPQLWPVRK